MERPWRPDSRIVMIGALLGLMAICWILLTPPGAGPDEPGHLARAGAVIRGDLEGERAGSGREAYELPDSYRIPEPACYAFQPTVGVDCAPVIESTDVTVTLTSRADEYPLWAHLYYGAASVLPGPTPVWWARAAGAVAAVALLTASIAAVANRRLAVAGMLAAVTPMAWSTFVIINPSAFGVAGAVALWTGMLDRSGRRSIAWLTAFGWLALALPRRDGLIWACLALALLIVVDGRRFRPWWRELGLGPQLVVAGSTITTVVWGITNDTRVSRMVALAPLIVVGADAWRWLWDRLGGWSRAAMVAGSFAISAPATALLLRRRPGGWDTDLARAVVGQTGTHLVEAIGVLGWLDTHLPNLVVIGWVGLTGVLLAAAITESPRLAALAAATLLTTVLASWVFELFQGNTSGRYWQGRYSLPLLAGVPIALARAPVRPDVARRLGAIVGIGALACVNVAAWAAARRWGVGVGGSLAPWRWDTVHQPVPPIILLAVHAVVTTALAAVLFGGDDRADADQVAANQAQRVMPSASTT